MSKRGREREKEKEKEREAGKREIILGKESTIDPLNIHFRDMIF